MARKDSFNKIWASNPAQFEKPGDALIERGWSGGASEDPPEAKWENWWHNRLDEALLEIQNSGALAWFPDVKYTKGALVNYGGKNWVALSANSNISPNGPLDNGIWLEVEYSKSDFLKKSQNGADIPDKNAFVKNLGLVETVNLANGAYQKSGGVVNGNVDATGSIYGRGVYDTGVRVYSATNKPSPGELGAYTITESNSLIVPVGVPLPYPHRYTPAGYLTCNGQTFDKSLYPKLAEAYPDGKVPDLRGEFIRGWDDSRGVDPGRVCGTWQEGSYSLQETYNPPDNVLSLSCNDRAKLQWDTPQNKDIQLRARASGCSATTWTANAAYIGVSRPRNVAFNYIVRAV